jgi:uncharacterized pyridoxamine 5'-phosphate oxidase family protein
MSQQVMSVFLRQQKVRRLATVDRQGKPHVVPARVVTWDYSQKILKSDV